MQRTISSSLGGVVFIGRGIVAVVGMGVLGVGGPALGKSGLGRTIRWQTTQLGPEPTALRSFQLDAIHTLCRLSLLFLLICARHASARIKSSYGTEIFTL